MSSSLTPGKRADLILVRVDQINTLPVHDPVAALVTCADMSNVDIVLVDGAVVKRNGRLVGAVVARVGALAVAAREYVTSSARSPAQA